MLTVHHTQGDRNVDQAVPTRDVLQPKKGKSFARRGKISCGRTTQKKGFPWAPLARGWQRDMVGGFRSVRPPGKPPTFDVPTKVPRSNKRKLPAEAAPRGKMEKSCAVTWQMDNQVHAWARNQAVAVRSGLAETADVCRWANGWSQNSNGPFEVASMPMANTVARMPSTNNRKLEPGKTGEEARPPPKPNLPKMVSKGKPKSLMQPQQ